MFSRTDPLTTPHERLCMDVLGCPAVRNLSSLLTPFGYHAIPRYDHSFPETN
jgi:hypothetical protein